MRSKLPRMTETQLKPIKFVIHTTPTGKGRPRVVIAKGKPHAFTPLRTMIAEQEIKMAVYQRYKELPFSPGTPLRLSVVFYMARPKSLPKQVTEHTKKPDIDNLLKTLMDGLSGYLVHSDAEVVQIIASKRYGSPARIEFEVEELEQKVKEEK